jgi:hypothetical protein
MYDTQMCPWYFGSRNPDVDSNTPSLIQASEIAELTEDV